jgi:hypothetical protein
MMLARYGRIILGAAVGNLVGRGGTFTTKKEGGVKRKTGP